MKRNHHVVAGIAAALSLAAAAAYAHPGAGMEPGMGHMGGMGQHGMAGGNHAAMADSHLAELKATLKITTAQEGAWQAFATKAKQQAQTMQARHSKMQEAAGTAPERMARHIEMMKQHIGDMEAMTAALKDLYAVLTPEQQALADQHFAKMHGPQAAHGRPAQ